ncbi:hypothetical protein AEQ67_28475 [Pseudomonas sp. RIT-PI-q]|uniref:hypothetical protein n=1 Tax=Pseudomonas sp. RIT-PI-q TaxID=1690247 RepID=UPI0006CD0A70|nr:hypothetical protein [Pseudomonas sp. RIT-PI-q]KPG91917.1 hypothetical protein AEQ67_28475 [Pseudomonas sp. RIT-PI-q]
MALMIIDFGDGDISEIEVPEVNADDIVPNELRQMGDWLGEVAQDAAEYLSVAEQLQKSDWVENDQTRPLFKKLHDKSLGFRAIPFDGHIKEFYTWVEQPGVMARLPKGTKTLFDSSKDPEITHKAGMTSEKAKEFFVNLTQEIICERDALPQENKLQQLLAFKQAIGALRAETNDRTAELITHGRAITEVYRSASTHRSLQSGLGTLLAPSLQPLYLEGDVLESNSVEVNYAVTLYPEHSLQRKITGRATSKQGERRTFEVGMTR